MPKFSKIVVPPIGKTRVMPHNEIDPNKDYYFCGFYPAWGFEDKEQAGNISEQLYNSIINGKKPIILKWNNAESAVSWEDGITDATARKTSLFKRNIKVGDYFVGRVESRNDGMNFATRDSGKATIQGDPINYKEQEIQRRIVVNAQPDYFLQEDVKEVITAKISAFKQRMFYICDELAGGDVLYIEDMEVKFDANRGIDYLRLTFASLADKLRTVGALIDSHVRFSQPGMGYPYPFIAPEQPDNTTDFYDIDADNVPGSKRVYISVPRLKDDGVFGMSIEFDGAVALNSIQIYGRSVVPEEEGEPNLRKLNRLVPIFLLTDEINTDYDRDRYNTSEVANYQVISGGVFHENWFTEWRDEWGLFFDPLKRRASHSVLKVLSNDNVISGDIVNLVETKYEPENWIKMYGRYGLQLNQWSQYTLQPTKAEEDTKDHQITFNGDNYTNYTDSMATFLNTQGIWNFADDYLEVGGIRTKNRKGHTQAVANDITNLVGTVGGGLIGAGVGGRKGAAVGGAVGSQATRILNKIFSWIPDRNFTDQDIYRPGIIKSFLVPHNMIVDFTSKVGDFLNEDTKSVIPEFRDSKQKNIPLELFADNNDNFLSGVVNTKTYKCNFRFKLTNVFQMLSKNKSGDPQVSAERSSTRWMNGAYGYDGVTKFYTDQSIRGVEPYDRNHEFKGFIIEDVKIRGLIKQPMTVKFYDENGYVLWQTTRLSQAGYNGNIFDWMTTIDFSNITDDQDLFLNDNYSYPDFEPKVVEETVVANETKASLAARAKRTLKFRPSITMKKKSSGNKAEEFLVNYAYTWAQHDRNKNSTEMRFGIDNPSKAIPEYSSEVWFDLPGDVKKNLKAIYWESPTSVDTLAKQLEILKGDPYNFTFGRIYDDIEWRNYFTLNTRDTSGSAPVCERSTQYAYAIREPAKEPYWSVPVPTPSESVTQKIVLGKNQFKTIGEYTNERKKDLTFIRAKFVTTSTFGGFRYGCGTDNVRHNFPLQWRFDWAANFRTLYKLDISNAERLYVRVRSEGMRIFLRAEHRYIWSINQEKYGKRTMVNKLELVKRE